MTESRGFKRRQFLAGSAGLLGAGLIGRPALLAAEVDRYDQETDVLVVGTGAAGSSAALFARQAGAAVMVVEKADYFGGTTAKSQGGYWMPANSLMRAQGLTDPKPQAMRYMARLAFPTLYNPTATGLGLPADAYALIETFYDNAARVVDALEEMEALRSTFFPGADGVAWMPDYYPTLPENAAPYGRILQPRKADGSAGMGEEIARQLQAALSQRQIPVLYRHRAGRLVLDEAGAVQGLELQTPEGAHRIRAHRGVIFGTGGFIHNPVLRRQFLRGPVYGGCTVPAAEGDFVPIAQAAGAQFGNMQNAWWAEILFEQAIHNSAVPMNVFVPPGDSMLQVNRYGRRYVNEKFVYNERSQAHFVWDARRAEYSQLLTFMVYDQRTASQFAGLFPLPPETAPYVISGADFGALTAALSARLTQLAPHSGGFSLDADFAGNLGASVARFNDLARQGKDDDFGRGESPTDQFFHTLYRLPGQHNEFPDATLHPLADTGPYHAIILCAGVLDTKGGPVIDTHSRVLDGYGEPIAGLYGAGNCIAAPAGQAYWSAGATIGAALVFGALAGQHAATRRGR
ncbi:FAD-dependent oxidoreductase [Immundisolibacter sp.]|uniref:FAD-dependent oxidoreductase n=3 Tax=Immundisolibacter sp. TaxID=1934948 RepID=UPI003567F1E2